MSTDSPTQEKSNVFYKMMMVKSEFSEIHVNRSGENQHSKRNYIQLQDILPYAIPLLKKHKVSVTFDKIKKDVSVMRVVDCENPDSFFLQELSSDDAPLPKAMPVQCIGAMITYMRRYSWLTLLDVCVRDEVEEEPDQQSESEDERIYNQFKNDCERSAIEDGFGAVMGLKERLNAVNPNLKKAMWAVMKGAYTQHGWKIDKDGNFTAP